MSTSHIAEFILNAVEDISNIRSLFFLKGLHIPFGVRKTVPQRTVQKQSTVVSIYLLYIRSPRYVLNRMFIICDYQHCDRPFVSIQD